MPRLDIPVLSAVETSAAKMSMWEERGNRHSDDDRSNNDRSNNDRSNNDRSNNDRSKVAISVAAVMNHGSQMD
jgi:hypothetical protein